MLLYWRDLTAVRRFCQRRHRCMTSKARKAKPFILPPRVMACNGSCQRWYFWHSWQRRIYNLWKAKSGARNESHPHRHKQRVLLREDRRLLVEFPQTGDRQCREDAGPLFQSRLPMLQGRIQHIPCSASASGNRPHHGPDRVGCSRRPRFRQGCHSPLRTANRVGYPTAPNAGTGPMSALRLADVNIFESLHRSSEATCQPQQRPAVMGASSTVTSTPSFKPKAESSTDQQLADLPEVQTNPLGPSATSYLTRFGSGSIGPCWDERRRFATL